MPCRWTSSTGAVTRQQQVRHAPPLTPHAADALHSSSRASCCLSGVLICPPPRGLSWPNACAWHAWGSRRTACCRMGQLMQCSFMLVSSVGKSFTSCMMESIPPLSATRAPPESLLLRSELPTPHTTASSSRSKQQQQQQQQQSSWQYAGGGMPATTPAASTQPLLYVITHDAGKPGLCSLRTLKQWCGCTLTLCLLNSDLLCSPVHAPFSVLLLLVLQRQTNCTEAQPCDVLCCIGWCSRGLFSVLHSCHSSRRQEIEGTDICIARRF